MERYRIVVEFSNNRNGVKSLLYLENIRSLSVSMKKMRFQTMKNRTNHKNLFRNSYNFSSVRNKYFAA